MVAKIKSSFLKNSFQLFCHKNLLSNKHEHAPIDEDDTHKLSCSSPNLSNGHHQQQSNGIELNDKKKSSMPRRSTQKTANTYVRSSSANVNLNQHESAVDCAQTQNGGATSQNVLHTQTTNGKTRNGNVANVKSNKTKKKFFSTHEKSSSSSSSSNHENLIILSDTENELPKTTSKNSLTQPQQSLLNQQQTQRDGDNSINLKNRILSFKQQFHNSNSNGKYVQQLMDRNDLIISKGLLNSNRHSYTPLTDENLEPNELNSPTNAGTPVPSVSTPSNSSGSTSSTTAPGQSPPQSQSQSQSQSQPQSQTSALYNQQSIAGLKLVKKIQLINRTNASQTNTHINYHPNHARPTTSCTLTTSKSLANGFQRPAKTSILNNRRSFSAAVNNNSANNVKKVVRFADALGLELESIITLQSSNQPVALSASHARKINYYRNSRTKNCSEFIDSNYLFKTICNNINENVTSGDTNATTNTNANSISNGANNNHPNGFAVNDVNSFENQYENIILETINGAANSPSTNGAGTNATNGTNGSKLSYTKFNTTNVKTPYFDKLAAYEMDQRNFLNNRANSPASGNATIANVTTTPNSNNTQITITTRLNNGKLESEV